ncbi:MAG: cache domain-containing protein [Thermoproteota archaeon]|nr:cache domain-containing protein [Thermoproteota archaeon]
MKIFLGKEREIGIISLISIIICSNGLLFYIQNITAADLKKTVFEQQKELQIQATSDIARHIGSDINLVMSMLYGLTNSHYIQLGELGGDKTTMLLDDAYNKHNLTIDSLFILDKEDIMVNKISAQPSEFFLGEDFSFRDWVKQTRSSLVPVFSNGDFERQQILREFISYPILNQDTEQYMGMIVTSIPTIPFFAHYGNVQDINSKFLVVYDKNGLMLANGASETLVGQNFFGNYTQEFINNNKILNNVTRNLLNGESGFAVYDYGRGERLTTQYPAYVNNQPTFFIQIVTPTSEIYSKIDNSLSEQRTGIVSQSIVASIIAIAVLVILLRRWNIILRREVKRRTQELEDSYNEMKHYLVEVLRDLYKDNK